MKIQPRSLLKTKLAWK